MWASITHVVRGLQDRDDTALGQTSGKFTAATEADAQALRECIDHEDDTRIEVDDLDDPARVAVGGTYQVLIYPRLGVGVLVRTLAELLAVPGARVRKLDFYVLSQNVSSTDAVDADSPIGRYLSVVKFVETLKTVAAFLNVEEQQLVFISDGKFEVPVKFDEEHLKQMNPAAVAKVASCLPEDMHRDECKTILAKSIVEQTQTVLIDNRFAELLIHAGDLKERYDEGYRLFTSGFSYEKVRDEVEATRIEYAGKIHKVIGDIQNQLLGIPVATIVVATQMKEATRYDSQYWINAAVVLGCWVFAFLVLMLLRNQSHTLKVIEDEIARQKKLMLTKYSGVAASFGGTFTYLESRAKHQRLIVRIIDFVVVLGLIMSHIVFVMLLT